MSIEKLRPSFTFTQDRLDELKTVVPEAFADGKINWDTLREALGDYLEDTGAEAEHFGLFWPGKRDARRLAARPSKGTLAPASGEGVNEDTTRNVFIEGDNLEVLKLLKKSYAGRVKMIYIDPPYNTGSDFVYKDDFSDPLEDYLRMSRQTDDQGNPLTTNTRADGRYHSNWLTMMYPRLLLARLLLREDGVIFVSIDDHEASNLHLVMDEIFGGENFIGQIVVQLNPRGRHLDKFLAKTHEYVVIYARDNEQQAVYELEKDERMSKEYSRNDQHGQYRVLELRNRNPAFNSKTRPNLYYPIYIDPKNGDVALEADSHHTVKNFPKNSSGGDSCWTWGKDKFLKDRFLLFASQTTDGGWRVFRKDYLIKADGSTATTLPKSLWIDKDINNDYGKKALQELFDGSTPFDFPKPPALIQKLLMVGTQADDIVLDFFAGSCTTAQAVLELNRDMEADKSRKFILVQLPEPVSGSSFGTIAELGKERIRRVIKKIKRDSKGTLILGSHSGSKDLGFRVYKLSRSNYRAWQDYTGDNTQEIETLFSSMETPLIDDWNEPGLLTEIMLLEGFPLDSVVAQQPTFKRNRVLLVESDACSHHLFICLDSKIKDETIVALKPRPEDIVVCLDSAISDEAKVRLANLCTLKTI